MLVNAHAALFGRLDFFRNSRCRRVASIVCQMVDDPLSISSIWFVMQDGGFHTPYTCFLRCSLCSPFYLDRIRTAVLTETSILPEEKRTVEISRIHFAYHMHQNKTIHTPIERGLVTTIRIFAASYWGSFRSFYRICD